MQIFHDLQLFPREFRHGPRRPQQRQLVRKVQADAAIPLYDVSTMQEQVTHSMASQRLSSSLISTFAAMALLYTLFAKFVPIISIWEMKAGAHPSRLLSQKASAEHRLGDMHA